MMEKFVPHHNSPDIALWTMFQLQKHGLKLQPALEKCVSHFQRETEGEKQRVATSKIWERKRLENMRDPF